MSDRILLACDVGNSRIKAALFCRQQKTSSPPKLPKCLTSWAVRKDEAFDWSLLRQSLQAGDVDVRGIIAGANPDGVARLKDDWPRDWVEEPTVVASADAFPLQICVHQPQEVGIDRLLNALAANVIRPPKTATVIVDSGTATTVDVVDSRGRFCGGAILPGFELSARALNRYTALLPLVTIEELAVETPGPLGLDTHAALRSGLFWGQLGAVRELIRRISADPSLFETGHADQPASILLTGGGASLLKPHLEHAVCEPHLSLQGLAILAQHLAT